MVDKITKFLNKRNKKGRKAALDLIEKVRKGQLEGCDVVQLKGNKNIFRLKKGRIRIFFEKYKKEFIVKKICYRDDQTYSDF